MKKITILCLAILTSIAISAREPGRTSANNSERHTLKESRKFKKAGASDYINERNYSVTSATGNQRISQVPFFSEVFAGGIPPTWQNIDSSGSGVRWTWTTIGSYYDYPGNDSLSTSGTSASNGYLMFDSDSAGGTLQGEYGVLITDAIDCSAHTTVRVTFNEFFAKFDDLSPVYINTGRVYISNDGTNWTMIHAADDGLASGDETPNPQAVSINVSSIAAGQSTVYFKFSFTGDYSYWWFVDDLELSEVGAIDAGIFGILDPFNGCALSSSEPIVIGVVNDGADSLSNLPVYYSINGGVPIAEIIADTLAPGDSLAYVFAAPADLSATGVYNILAYVAYPGDATTANDTVSIATTSFAPNAVVYTMGFEISDDLSGYSIVDNDGDGEVVDLSMIDFRSGSYCLRFPEPIGTSADNWMVTSCFNFTSSVIYDLDFWMKVFDVTAPAVPYSLEVYIGDSPDISTMTILTAPPVPTDTSYTNVNSTFSVSVSGNYYLAFRAYGTNVDNPIRIDDILVQFGVGINNPELNDALSVYPNPSQGTVNIMNCGTGHESATINVINSLGQIVATHSSGNFVKETIHLETQPEGLYTIQILTQSGVINKPVMITKN